MKCCFNRLIYPKSIEEAQNGSYMIAIFIPRETILDSTGNKLHSFTVVGYNLPTSCRITVDLSGHWKRDPKYGLQFEMDSYDEVIEPGKAGIVAYLSSGLIRGIGPKLAERIYNTFGEDTITELDRAPERISEVPGITAKKKQADQQGVLEGSWGTENHHAADAVRNQCQAGYPAPDETGRRYGKSFEESPLYGV